MPYLTQAEADAATAAGVVFADGVARNAASLSALRGWKDDGTPTGRLRTQQVSGGWIMQPFLLSGRFAVTGSSGAGLPSLQADFQDIETPWRTGILAGLAAVSAAPLGSYQQIDFDIVGDRFGIIVDTTAARTKPIGCFIDRVAYPVNFTSALAPESLLVSTRVQAEPFVYIADDLGPGRHHVTLTFPSGPETRFWGIGGYLVDAASGAREYPNGYNLNRGKAIAVSTTSTSAGATQLPPLNSDMTHRGYRGIIFYNPTAGAVTITLTVEDTVFTAKSIPAGESWTFDPLAHLYFHIKAYASGTGVLATVIGSN